MDSKIINLFSFLNSKEEVFTTDIFSKLSTLDELKKFKNIPKKTLDILICKHGFNPDNKEIVDYSKSLGGSDELFKDVKQWMDNMFKDLKKFNSDKYPESTFYGTSKDNILIEQDLENDWNYIHYAKVYSVFESKYSSYISKYQDIMSVFQEYLVNTLHLKGSRTQLWHKYSP